MIFEMEVDDSRGFQKHGMAAGSIVDGHLKLDGRGDSKSSSALVTWTRIAGGEDRIFTHLGFAVCYTIFEADANVATKLLGARELGTLRVFLETVAKRKHADPDSFCIERLYINLYADELGVSSSHLFRRLQLQDMGHWAKELLEGLNLGQIEVATLNNIIAVTINL